MHEGVYVVPGNTQYIYSIFPTTSAHRAAMRSGAVRCTETLLVLHESCAEVLLVLRDFSCLRQLIVNKLEGVAKSQLPARLR